MNQYQAELYHHGIKGQKWGERNGPPYPLGSSDHSTAEKKARWKKSPNRVEKAEKKAYNKTDNNDKDGFHLTDQQKKAIKIGVAVAATALAAYGAYRIANSDVIKDLSERGRSVLSDSTLQSFVYGKPGKSSAEIDRKMVRKLNGPGYRKVEGQINCEHCSVAYILNSIFGKNVVAKGFSGVDEASGMVMGGRSNSLISAIFDGVKIDKNRNARSMHKMLVDLQPGSTGILFMGGRSSNIGHIVNYEKTRSGIVSIIDGQIGKVLSEKDALRVYPALGLTDIHSTYDLSTATIKQGAENILKYMVSDNH